MANLGDRMVRAARLNLGLYEEVEADKSALGQAIGVVLLSSIAAGIGSVERAGFGEILVESMAALVGTSGHILRT